MHGLYVKITCRYDYEGFFLCGVIIGLMEVVFKKIFWSDEINPPCGKPVSGSGRLDEIKEGGQLDRH
jgi:hypothetical protein